MKKIFGWVFIIAGIGNIIRVIGLASEGIVGGDKKIGELFLFGIGFMALGGWMVYSAPDKISSRLVAIAESLKSVQSCFTC
jgi:hypothetical protein